MEKFAKGKLLSQLDLFSPRSVLQVWLWPPDPARGCSISSWSSRIGRCKLDGGKRQSRLSVFPYRLLIYWSEVLVIQLCPTLYDPIGCSLPDSSAHGILQARILQWVAIPFSKKSSQHRDWTHIFYISGGFFTIWATRETLGGLEFQVIENQIKES